jgi:hypothetical protein
MRVGKALCLFSLAHIQNPAEAVGEAFSKSLQKPLVKHSQRLVR